MHVRWKQPSVAWSTFLATEASTNFPVCINLEYISFLGGLCIWINVCQFQRRFSWFQMTRQMKVHGFAGKRYCHFGVFRSFLLYQVSWALQLWVTQRTISSPSVRYLPNPSWKIGGNPSKIVTHLILQPKASLLSATIISLQHLSNLSSGQLIVLWNITNNGEKISNVRNICRITFAA